VSSKNVECQEDMLTGEMGGELKGCRVSTRRRRVDHRDGR
jgi:hypothetical protein